MDKKSIFYYYFQLCRPFTLILPPIGITVASYIAYQISLQPIAFGWVSFIIHTALAAVGAVLLNAASNAINQVYDLENDRIVKPTRPLPSGQLTIPGVLAFSMICYVLSFLAFTYAFQARLIPLFIVTVGAIFTLLYSVPPFHLKRFLWIANFAIALPRGLLMFLAGWSVSSQTYLMPDPWFLSSVMFVYLMGAVSIKDFSDVAGDKASGVTTLPIKYGPETAAKIISPFLIIPFVILIIISLLKITGIYPVILQCNAIILLCFAILLTMWNLYLATYLIRYPLDEHATENHPVWRHMYFITFTYYIGLAISYNF